MVDWLGSTLRLRAERWYRNMEKGALKMALLPVGQRACLDSTGPEFTPQHPHTKLGVVAHPPFGLCNPGLLGGQYQRLG